MVLVDTHGRGRCESAGDGGRSRGGVCVCLPEMGRSFTRCDCTAPKWPSEDTENVGGGEGRRQGQRRARKRHEVSVSFVCLVRVSRSCVSFVHVKMSRGWELDVPLSSGVITGVTGHEFLSAF